jgi:hypothetical protein
MMIDDELMQLCKWLNVKRDVEVSPRGSFRWSMILTHILLEAGTSCTEMG